MIVDDLLGAPGRESLTVLDPLRRGRATCYTFQKQFDWERSINETVKVEYERKAQKSFSSNLCAWKNKWKLNKDPPDWLSNKAWEGYVLMWQDEKVEAKSSRNSTNRRSERGGYGIAIHNTGATTFETRKEEMIIENGGEEPDMLAFLEDAHRNRKSGDICDKKVKRIVETVKEKINDQLTQGGSTETNHLTQAEINTRFKGESITKIPTVKGHRFGFGTLPDPGQPPSSARFMSNLDQDEQLRIANEKIVLADEKIAVANEKIVTLENDKVDKGKVIKYLQSLAHKVVSKFPELLDEDEDEDATQG
ncbi:hypothetical protein Bca4012_035786 [Brassica carinata]